MKKTLKIFSGSRFDDYGNGDDCTCGAMEAGRNWMVV